MRCSFYKVCCQKNTTLVARPCVVMLNKYKLIERKLKILVNLTDNTVLGIRYCLLLHNYFFSREKLRSFEPILCNVLWCHTINLGPKVITLSFHLVKGILFFICLMLFQNGYHDLPNRSEWNTWYMPKDVMVLFDLDPRSSWPY